MKELLKIKLICILLFSTNISVGQEEISKTFYDTRIVNGQSTELSQEGQMKFIIAHRFGQVNGGAYELFGLDQSTIRLGLDYGIKDWLNIGVGRSSNEKTLDGFVKVRLMKQDLESKPVSIVALSNVAMNGLKSADPDREILFSSRMFYSYQILVSRKMSDRISLQLMPSLVHRNLVPTEGIAHDVLSIGSAIRFQVSKRLTINAEYYYVLPDQLSDEFENSLAIGFDLETKGHVFQFHIGNSRGMTEKFFISETRGSWMDGDIRLGFNITRDFKIKGRKY